MQVVKELESINQQIINVNDNYTTTKNKIINNIDKYEAVVAKVIKNNNYKISYGENYFPQKKYKDIIYPEGTYESLLVTIGKGQGDNWWCVLYPPLCLIEYNNQINNLEFKLYIKELFNK